MGNSTVVRIAIQGLRNGRPVRTRCPWRPIRVEPYNHGRMTVRDVLNPLRDVLTGESRTRHRCPADRPDHSRRAYTSRRCVVHRLLISLYSTSLFCRSVASCRGWYCLLGVVGRRLNVISSRCGRPDALAVGTHREVHVRSLS